MSGTYFKLQIRFKLPFKALNKKIASKSKCFFSCNLLSHHETAPNDLGITHYCSVTIGLYGNTKQTHFLFLYITPTNCFLFPAPNRDYNNEQIQGEMIKCNLSYPTFLSQTKIKSHGCSEGLFFFLQLIRAATFYQSVSGSAK